MNTDIAREQETENTVNGKINAIAENLRNLDTIIKSQNALEVSFTQCLTNLSILLEDLSDILVDVDDRIEQNVLQYISGILNYILALVPLSKYDHVRNISEIRIADLLQFEEKVEHNPKRIIWSFGNEKVNSILESCIFISNRGLGRMDLPSTLSDAQAESLDNQYILHNLRMRACEIQSGEFDELYNLSFNHLPFNMRFWLRVFQGTLKFFPFESFENEQNEKNGIIKSFFLGLSTNKYHDGENMNPEDFVDLICKNKKIPKNLRADIVTVFGPSGLNWISGKACNRILKF